jgi:phospholipase D-like protein
MLLFDGLLGLVFLGLWIFCIIDVITTPESQCRNLPKIAWLLIVILLMDIGSIAWLVAGRNWDGAARAPLTKAPARPRGRTGTGNPDDDEEFLASLRTRAEEQRRRAREAQENQPGPRAKDEPDRPLEEP